MAVLLVLLSGPAWAKVDPESSLIRVISIGEAYYPETRVPLLLRADPRIRYQPVPTNWYEGTFASVGAGRKDALKFIRQYMPRTYERLIKTYDVTLLSDFDVDVITHTQFMWMERSVREDDMGLAKYEMNYDPAHWHTFDLFCQSAVYPAFPTDLIKGKTLRGIGIYATVLPDGKPHPMLDLPGMKNNRVPVDIGSGKCGYENPRSGSTVVARFVPEDEPAIIIWDYGKGQSLVSVPGHDTIDWSVSAEWPYTADFWINQIWYLAGLEIPREAVLLHELRVRSMTYSAERTAAVSLIEFVEKFGALTQELYDDLLDVDAVKKEADRLYLTDRFTESIEKMDEAFKGLRKVAEDSVRTKDKVLFWIYVVEWCTVMATSVLAGLTVWVLMVRRRLYKEVEITRSV